MPQQTMIYQDVVLDNGLRILMIPEHTFQSVSMGIFVKVGARYETAIQSGLSHFIEHMLFKGTTNRPSAKLIAETIEGVGGVSNAYTGQENTAYYAKVAASQANTALNFLADLVRNPLLDPTEFEKERLVIGEEISMIYDSPDSWIDNLIDEVIWPNHPLGQSIAGSRESLKGISHIDLVSFFKRTYHPKNVLVAVGGAFEQTQVVDELNNLLGDWPPATLPTFTPAPQPQTTPRYLIEDRAIEQGHLCLALPGLPRSHPNRYALTVLNTILGDGMSSRLFLNIREDKGLAYAIDSGLSFLHDTGSFVIYAGVDPQRAPEALQSILAELEKLRDQPIPPEELHKAKEYIKGRLVLGLEDSYSRAAWVAYQALFTDTIKSPQEVLEAYDAVTLADVQAIAQQVITPNRYNLAVIGPFGKGEDLARLVDNRR